LLRSLEILGGDVESIEDYLRTGFIGLLLFLDSFLEGFKIFLVVFIEVNGSLLLGLLLDILGSQLGEVSGVLENFNERIFL